MAAKKLLHVVRIFAISGVLVATASAELLRYEEFGWTPANFFAEHFSARRLDQPIVLDLAAESESRWEIFESTESGSWPWPMLNEFKLSRERFGSHRLDAGEKGGSEEAKADRKADQLFCRRTASAMEGAG